LEFSAVDIFAALSSRYKKLWPLPAGWDVFDYLKEPFFRPELAFHRLLSRDPAFRD